MYNRRLKREKKTFFLKINENKFKNKRGEPPLAGGTPWGEAGLPGAIHLRIQSERDNRLIVVVAS